MLEKLTDPEEKRYRLFGHLPHSIIPLLQDTERPSQASVSSSNWSSWADGDCSGDSEQSSLLPHLGGLVERRPEQRMVLLERAADRLVGRDGGDGREGCNGG